MCFGGKGKRGGQKEGGGEGHSTAYLLVFFLCAERFDDGDDDLAAVILGASVTVSNCNIWRNISASGRK